MEKEVIQVEIPAGKKAAWVDGFLKLVDAEEEQKTAPEIILCIKNS